ncbi:hypothetical protein [Nocardia farcinica]|uniref:hypothetical protein n=1 Tax=Nocardia farcinica TaxID=37329 RepID=UPI001892E923|nr:hypothetical protein [Nocardia farcinica]MBF6372973.1 hypothetical protein [Nocardia farcinica]
MTASNPDQTAESPCMAKLYELSGRERVAAIWLREMAAKLTRLADALDAGASVADYAAAGLLTDESGA